MLKRKLLTALCATSLTFVGAGCGDDEPNNPNPPPAQTYSVGGSVSGLEGSGLVLTTGTNNVVTVSANGAFTFPTELTTGTAYAVTVQTQPSSPSQTCAVTNGSGTVGSADVTNVQVACTTNSFTVGGTVTGLAGTGLTLRNNGGDTLAVSANGAFTFATRVESGEAFAVTIATQPSGPTQTCTVSGGTGTVGAGNVTTVTVNCATNTFTVGGTVSGLVGEVTLALAAGGAPITATVTSEGTFAFGTAVASGTEYTVTVQTQPANQTCTVANGTGEVGSANVTDVAVTCTDNQATTFTVGGTVTGLTGTLVLQNNAGDDRTVTADGPFTFATPLAAGGAYAVTVLTQPAGLTCSVTDGSGNVGSANVSNVAVSCIPNVMVLRVGNGQTPPASGTSVAIALQEFRPVGDTALRTVDIATTEASLTYSSTSEGGLSRSTDRRLVTFGAYRIATGTVSVTGATAAAVRTAVSVDAAGTASFLNFPGAFLGSNVRGAATVDGTAYWLSGTSSGTLATGGVWHALASGGAPVRVVANPNNARWVEVYENTLYVSSSSGANVGVNTVPSLTDPAQTATLVEAAGADTTGTAGGTSSPYGFAFVDTDAAAAGPEVLYVAHDNTSVNTGSNLNVQKFVWTAGEWVRQATFAPFYADGTTGARGVAAARLANGTTLVYAVTGGSTGGTLDNRVVTFTDDGSTPPTVTTIGSAGTDFAFRGIALAPVAPAVP